MKLPAIDRFRAKFVVDASGCWIWTGCRDRNGYGRFGPGGAGLTAFAHRWSYEHFVGPIAEALVIDHLCRNTSCVNPEHLEAVTNAENTRRGDLWQRAVTHCPAGHAYAGDNLVTDGIRRWCRACRRAAHERFAERRRERRNLSPAAEASCA